MDNNKPIGERENGLIQQEYNFCTTADPQLYTRNIRRKHWVRKALGKMGFLELVLRSFSLGAGSSSSRGWRSENKMIDSMHNRCWLVDSCGAKKAPVGSSWPRDREVSETSCWCSCSMVQGMYWIHSTLSSCSLIWIWFTKLRMPRWNTSSSDETIIGIVHAVLKHHSYSKLQKEIWHCTLGTPTQQDNFEELLPRSTS